MAGTVAVDSEAMKTAEDTYIKNLKFAADECAKVWSKGMRMTQKGQRSTE